MGKSKKTFSLRSFCQFANLTILFCQQNEQNWKIEKYIFHSAHRKSKNTFFILLNENRKIHFSFCSFCQFADFIISFCQQKGQSGRIEKRLFPFCSFCQFSNFTISFCSFCQFANFTSLFCSFCQFANFTFHSAHSASLLTLPFHSARSDNLLT